MASMSAIAKLLVAFEALTPYAAFGGIATVPSGSMS